jgi:hypothetical protein
MAQGDRHDGRKGRRFKTVLDCELRAAFHPGTGWNVAAVDPDRVQTRYHDDDGAPAWLATFRRI